MGNGPYLFSHHDENFLREFSHFRHAFTSVPEDLHNEQGEAHLNLDFPESPFLGNDIQESLDFSLECDPLPVAEFMSDYDGTDSLTLSSPVSWGSSETVDYRLSPSSPHIQAESPLSMDSFNGVEQHATDTNSKLRQILPRPAELMSVNAEAARPPAKKRQDGETKDKRSGDLARRERRKPVLCHLCPKIFGCRKGLKRHYVVYHKDHAASVGLPVGRTPCPIQGCVVTLSRSDYVPRHLKTKHGRTRP